MFHWFLISSRSATIALEDRKESFVTLMKHVLNRCKSDDRFSSMIWFNHIYVHASQKR